MFRVYAAAGLVATLLAVFARTFIVQAFTIPSDSMEPGLLAGDHILVNKLIYRPGRGFPLLPRRDVRRGDVVVFAAPPNRGPADRGPAPRLIKRCAALPGETVEIDSRGLWIDGVRVDESGYVRRSGRRSPEGGFGPYTVPPGHYFFLGDHRDRSRDSRAWGPVAAERLIGRAVLIYWSVRAREPVAQRRGRWSKMRRGVGSPVDWLLRSRWERCFRPVR
jgi:signal peptidase I